VKRFYQTSYGLARVLDEAAEVEFAQQWQTYRKLVDNNDVFHLEAYATLHRILVDEVAGPFRFLDLACGDARGIVEMLKTTKVAHYHGVDLSRPVLDLARVALEALACPVELDQRDFIAAMVHRSLRTWSGSGCRCITSNGRQADDHARSAWRCRGGRVVRDLRDEDRAGYLARFAAVSEPLWRALTTKE
jgi:hypothetical protein